MIKTLYMVLFLATPEVPEPTPSITEVKTMEECMERGQAFLADVARVAGTTEQYKATFACQVFQRTNPTL